MDGASAAALQVPEGWLAASAQAKAREAFRDDPKNFDLRPPGKVFMAEYAKFIAHKNVKLGSAGQIDAVRTVVKAR